MQRVEAFLRASGVDRIRIEKGGRHPKLVFMWQGREIKRVISATPSDARAPLNAIADLRREMGLTAGGGAQGERREKRRRTKPQEYTEPAANIEYKPDWRDALAAIAKRIIR